VRAGRTIETRSGGLTLVEVIIGVTVLVIAILVAVPNIIAAKMRANEAAAVELMQRLATSQAQFQKACHADEDFDGVGEFGTIAEMSGHIGVRGLSTKAPANPAAAIGQVDVAGEVQAAGYVFRVYLPAAGGRGRREQPYGGMPAGAVEPDFAELHWACYAWPVNSGISGGVSLFVNESGIVLQSRDDERSGQNSAHVRAGDAYLTDDPERIVDDVAIGATGSDGREWMPLD
jgi:hypothetical protein